MPDPTNYIATSTELAATADAIRAKTGYSTPIEWEEDTGFAAAIADIPSGGGSVITVIDSTDSHGGTIKTIEAVDISRDTVTSAALLSGYTAHNRLGEAISGSYVPSGSTPQTKTVTPTETAQVITADSGYMLQEVDVDAVPSDYVGSDITRRSSTDMTASGATVTAPAGYYSASATKSVASGTEGTPSASKGAVNNHSIAVTPSVTNSAGYISGGTKTGTAVTVSASELVSGTKSITSNGTGIDVTNYAAVDVAVASTPLQTKSVNPTESAQTVTPDSGYALSEVSVGAISSSYVGSGITRRSSSDLSASGATVTAPAGYYSSAATKSVTSGTAGTPTATKGSVSNHSITVTPSVTNTTGYITGSTKTGTGVTVSASELVSGNKSITSNGTNIDVANYSTVTVNVSGGTGKNIQVANEYKSRANSSYGATGLKLTVAKTGTYTITWVGWRASSSGTSGSQLYKNDTAVGSAVTSFTGTYGQLVTLTNQSLSADDVIEVYARSRNTSYAMYVANLTIIEN